MKSVGIRGLSVRFPSEKRTNQYFRQHAAEVVAKAERMALGEIFRPVDTDEVTAVFDEEMRHYLCDPFRGTSERRALGPRETSITLETQAVADCLAAAGRPAEEIDLLISVSFRPQQAGPGNGAFVAQALGMRATVMNLEATCSGASLAIETAAALIRTGTFRNAMIAVSCTYSRDLDLRDSLAWFLGDGAGAILMGELPEGQGLLSFHSISTAPTCGAFVHDLETDEAGRPTYYLRPGSNNPSRALRATAAPNMLECTRSALAKAGATIQDVKFVVVNTPVAWFHTFTARCLGIDPAKTLSTFDRFANTGPVLTSTNLYVAAQRGLIQNGDLVLVYAFGTVSNAIALVMRWGDVALGPPPAA